MWGPTEQLVHPGRKLVYPKNWTIDPADDDEGDIERSGLVAAEIKIVLLGY
jgi:hypothetical protein